MPPRPKIQFKSLVNFPAQVYGRTGITVNKTAGAYYLDVNYASFTPVGPIPADASILLYSPLNNSYALGPVTTIVQSVTSTGIPQNSKSAAYTTVLTDQEKHLFHPSADTTARTWTIDSNANVPYAVGTAITFVNQNAAGVITIAITADTMRLAGAGTTGNRTLAANGVCTALKITATEWIISGTGLT